MGFFVVMVTCCAMFITATAAGKFLLLLKCRVTIRKLFFLLFGQILNTIFWYIGANFLLSDSCLQIRQTGESALYLDTTCNILHLQIFISLLLKQEAMLAISI